MCWGYFLFFLMPSRGPPTQQMSAQILSSRSEANFSSSTVTSKVPSSHRKREKEDVKGESPFWERMSCQKSPLQAEIEPAIWRSYLQEPVPVLMPGVDPVWQMQTGESWTAQQEGEACQRGLSLALTWPNLLQLRIAGKWNVHYLVMAVAASAWGGCYVCWLLVANFGSSPNIDPTIVRTNY